MNSRAITAACIAAFLASCATSEEQPQRIDLGIEWALQASEYRAVSMQVYNMASAALPAKIADESWSALPDQVDAGGLPVAVILDVDETSVSNARFQETLVPPFRDEKLNAWSAANTGEAVPGAVDFVRDAISAGVDVFFLTNRPCEPIGDDPCPQKPVVIDELTEAGFPASDDNVTLSYQRPEWTKEKSIRRNDIARTHRVIMLFGDDLGDFIACTRKRALDPCDEGATRTSRRALVEQYADYWGNGWYVLPNPMHGSWTSF